MPELVHEHDRRARPGFLVVQLDAVGGGRAGHGGSSMVSVVSVASVSPPWVGLCATSARSGCRGFCAVSCTGSNASGNTRCSNRSASALWRRPSGWCGLAWRAGSAVWRTQRSGLHVARNLAHLGGQFGWFFAIASILLIKGFLETNGIIVTPFALSVWAIPTAVAALLIHGTRLILLDRALKREAAR